jgi:hypothetical protein
MAKKGHASPAQQEEKNQGQDCVTGKTNARQSRGKKIHNCRGRIA